jgi:D-alanyl-D-alanine carboxypeptidase
MSLKTQSLMGLLLLAATTSATGATSALSSTSALASTIGAKDLRTCIAEEARKADFNGVISVARPGGNVTYAQGLMGGLGSAAMLPNAQFNIGSATKMWTGVAVAQLVDAGKIRLNDPIGRYVSGLTHEASAVTIRQLLTHSGGLGNFLTPDNSDVTERARSLSDLKSLLLNEKPAFRPGSRSEYSNSGFLLLGLMIEQVSGKSYVDYLQQFVFEPAGMTGSGLFPGATDVRAIGMTNFLPPEEMERLMPPPPMGPRPKGRGGPPMRMPPMGPPPQGRIGPPMGPPPGQPDLNQIPKGPLRPAIEATMMGTSAGGSFSTPEDMQRFFAAVLGTKLTSPAMRDALIGQQILLLPARGPLPAIYYGLGFSVASFEGRTWVGHNGGAPGVNFASMAFPNEQKTLIVMSNRDPMKADELARKIRPMLFDPACSG